MAAAVGSGRLELAAKIAFAGVKVEWAKLIGWMGEKWNTFLGGVVSDVTGWIAALNKAADHLEGLATGMTAGAVVAVRAHAAVEANPDVIAKRAELAKLMAEAKAATRAGAVAQMPGAAVNSRGDVSTPVKSVRGAFDSRSFAGVFGGPSGNPAKKVESRLGTANVVLK